MVPRRARDADAASRRAAEGYGVSPFIGRVGVSPSEFLSAVAGVDSLLSLLILRPDSLFSGPPPTKRLGANKCHCSVLKAGVIRKLLSNRSMRKVELLSYELTRRE